VEGVSRIVDYLGVGEALRRRKKKFTNFPPFLTHFQSFPRGEEFIDCRLDVQIKTLHAAFSKFVFGQAWRGSSSSEGGDWPSRRRSTR
jgi:hypothetical protein